jgi:hypothetical protein
MRFSLAARASWNNTEPPIALEKESWHNKNKLMFNGNVLEDGAKRHWMYNKRQFVEVAAF